VKSRYGFRKTVATTFDVALEKVTQELQKEGFGILTEIDVAATLKKKLNHDLPPYRILGACNPPFAMRALTAEPTVGLLLPCNEVVRQDNAGTVHVEFMDPGIMRELTTNADIGQVAAEVRERLQRMFGAL
jgi:uncharacterized protein (DUF302 family)